MSDRRAYHEETVPFDGDPLLVAAQVARMAGESDYVLYEHDGEWSLGMGVHARMDSYAGKTVLTLPTGQVEMKNSDDLSVTIDEVLGKIPVDGWRAYGLAPFELSRHLYDLPVSDTEALVKLFIPEREVRLRKGEATVRSLDADGVEELKKIVAEAEASPDVAPRQPLVLRDEIASQRAEPYKQSVQGALEEIWAHDYRKVILSRKIELQQSLDMVASYVTGRQANTPARSYLLSLDGLEAAGFSPETVAEVTADREVFTTPLAGTRSTGADVMEELALREELLSDSKEIAEHAISVYVAFDELTMACHPASVRVVNFMIVSRRGTVQHLASRLRGELLESSNPWHVFNALFPAVTASGVPKRESIDAIGRHEPEPRGLYSGCVMICDQDGSLDSALVLRSFYQRDGKAWAQAGAGIMNMSTPERELEETREKVSSVALYLIGAS